MVKVRLVLSKLVFGALYCICLDYGLFCIMDYLAKKRKPTDASEVMFFTDKGAGCRQHIYDKSGCGNDGCAYSNIRRIVDFMNCARETLDVCIYLVTCHDLANAILKVHERGVRVRIIADADMAEGSGSQISTFKKQGIPVRMKDSPFLMHHKYFIVDHTLLVTGSFNWTMQAITGNWDNVIVAAERELLEPFDRHFSHLWQEFEKYS
ncbi:Mitochondrial cardiolipin hydrolase [Gryllus bimaculatus]|nr:Mitochondrial cardiolipin hydrolase [Gryllus bimaculatus]